MGKPRKSNQNVIGVLPAVIASVIVVACYCILTVKGSKDMGRNADPALVSGGFLVTQAPKAFQRLEKRREGRGSHSELNVRLPDPAELTTVQSVEPLYGTQSLRSIEPVWQPSDKTKGSGWAYLTTGIRREIDAPGAERRRWDGIVLHQSSTRGGNGSMLALYHDQVLRLGDGLAYHFVIGNGIYSSAGLIEVGERWSTQAPAGSPASDSPDPRSISICLIGDFSDEPPKPEQLAALDELIHYLRAKLGNIELRSHHRSNDGMTSCPGRYFPRESFIERLNPHPVRRQPSSLAASSVGNEDVRRY